MPRVIDGIIFSGCDKGENEFKKLKVSISLNFAASINKSRGQTLKKGLPVRRSLLVSQTSRCWMFTCWKPEKIFTEMVQVEKPRTMFNRRIVCLCLSMFVYVCLCLSMFVQIIQIFGLKNITFYN